MKSVLIALVVTYQFARAKKKVLIPFAIAEAMVEQALGYAWEIGKGKPMVEMVDASPDNPFLNPNWRKDVA